MFFRVLTYIFVVGSLLAYFFSGYYIAELAISFLPYWFLVSLIILLFWLLVSVFSWQKLQFKKHARFLKIEKLVFILLWLFLSVLYGMPIKQFYYTHDQSQNFGQDIVINQSGTDDNISVLFANLLYTNTEYDGIQHMISDNDPDILMFVEFSDHHYEHLEKYLLKNYPYVNRATWSKNLMVWSMVFSKYPINNIVENFGQWAWRYWYFEIVLDQEPYYFYLVHTSSPVSLSFWRMRNRQLTTLFNDFTLHDKFRKHNNIVMLWDFNLSPWSKYYQDFIENFKFRDLIDITNTQGLIFSWLWPVTFASLPLLQVHIDHIFTNRKDSVIFDRVLSVLGSDHKALLFSIKWSKR